MASASNVALNLPSPDLGQASAFLNALAGGDRFARFTFQTFGEGSAYGNKALNRVLHGTLAEHATTLIDLNDRGAGVFVMVNEGDGKGRKASNVKRVRAVFADFDGAPIAPLDDIDLKPHIVVESSADRWHAYWLVDGLPLSGFTGMQAAIAARFGADPKVKDLPRVMRVPGFFHRKTSSFLTRIAEERGVPSYKAEQLAALFPSAHVTDQKLPDLPDRSVISTGTRNETLFGLAVGFVRKGLTEQAVNDRVQKVNAERCDPPLGVDEVHAICANAAGRGSAGFTYFPHALSDSPELFAMKPPAVAILLTVYRKYDGSNNGRLAVPWSEAKGRHGFANKGAFYKHLESLVEAGLLLKTAEARATQNGNIPAMYAIPDEFLPPRKVL